jgi:hypothetical protein
MLEPQQKNHLVKQGKFTKPFVDTESKTFFIHITSFWKYFTRAMNLIFSSPLEFVIKNSLQNSWHFCFITDDKYLKITRERCFLTHDQACLFSLCKFYVPPLEICILRCLSALHKIIVAQTPPLEVRRPFLHSLGGSDQPSSKMAALA